MLFNPTVWLTDAADKPRLRKVKQNRRAISAPDLGLAARLRPIMLKAFYSRRSAQPLVLPKRRLNSTREIFAILDVTSTRHPGHRAMTYVASRNC